MERASAWLSHRRCAPPREGSTAVKSVSSLGRGFLAFAAAGLVDHHLDTPGLTGAWAAPDIVDSCSQVLTGAPWAQGARRVCGPAFPAVQGLLDAELVRAQHHHVNIAVIADPAPDGQLDREPAGDPPRAGHCREDLSDFPGLRRLPGTERGHDSRHEPTILPCGK
jgi:hypothetical protein